MFGFFKNGFSLVDLPKLLARVEEEWAAHEATLDARFKALEERMRQLDGGGTPRIASVEALNVPVEPLNPATAINTTGENHA